MRDRNCHNGSAYIVTNRDGNFLKTNSGSGGKPTYQWVEAMREATVFTSRWAARTACFAVGGYIVELNGR